MVLMLKLVKLILICNILIIAIVSILILKLVAPSGSDPMQTVIELALVAWNLLVAVAAAHVEFKLIF